MSKVTHVVEVGVEFDDLDKERAFADAMVYVIAGHTSQPLAENQDEGYPYIVTVSSGDGSVEDVEVVDNKAL